MCKYIEILRKNCDIKLGYFDISRRLNPSGGTVEKYIAKAKIGGKLFDHYQMV
jgi:hypothetical protein